MGRYRLAILSLEKKMLIEINYDNLIIILYNKNVQKINFK